MGQFNHGHSFLKKSLALAVATVLMSSANAATDKEEIQQLRQEVEALKALIKDQQQVQQQQQVQLAEVKAQPAPEIALKSKAKANVDIYGFVRADAGYQFKGGPNTFNHINAVDLQGNKANEDKLYATAKTTRIGLDFKAPVEGADVGGKIEVDFADTSNDKNSLRIRHAYLTYNNWLFGQTTSSFVSTETQPEMLDFGSPLGIGTYRTPQVRFTDKINANTRYFVGLEKGADDNRLPALTGKISNNFADGAGVVTGRALLQEVRARDVNDETAFGWGVGLGLNFKPVEQLSLNADYSHVKGDSGKFILYTASNPSYEVKSNGRDINLTDFDALTLGATYKINQKLRSTLGYGAIFFQDAVGAQNDQLQQGWLNVMYNPVKPITFGAEYVYGERETAGDQIGRDSRFGLMAKYDF